MKTKHLNIYIITLIVALFSHFSLAEQPMSKENNVIPKVTIFAAASTSDLITEISFLSTINNYFSIDTAFGASSTMARQIEAGANADIFISANKNWLDYLKEKSIVTKSYEKIWSNSLVAVTSNDSPTPQLFEELLKDGSSLIAIGDYNHVPAGIYAKKLLENLGLWDYAKLKNKLVLAKTVREALLFAETGEVSMAIVYKTDALISNKVNIIKEFPVNEPTSPQIWYYAGIIGENTPEKEKLLNLIINSEESKKLIKKYGFTTAEDIKKDKIIEMLSENECRILDKKYGSLFDTYNNCKKDTDCIEASEFVPQTTHMARCTLPVNNNKIQDIKNKVKDFMFKCEKYISDNQVFFDCYNPRGTPIKCIKGKCVNSLSLN